MIIKWKLCSNDENGHPFMKDLHIVFYPPCQGMKIILRWFLRDIKHTLPRGGGTAFPISLCLSRIVPANSKSSLKVIQVVKNVRNWFRLCKIVRPFYFLHINLKLHAPETLTPRIFPHTEESILLWMQHLVHLIFWWDLLYNLTL